MKGNLADQIYITVILLAFSIMCVISLLIWNSASPALNTTLSQSEGGTLNSGSAIAITQTHSTLLMLDQLFVFIAFGTFIAIIISCFFLDTNPIFFIVSMIIFVFQFIIYAVLGNVYAVFATSSDIQATASLFPFMYMFWSNIPIIALVVSILVIIMLYARMRGKSNGYAA
jgi:hypothetical protein